MLLTIFSAMCREDYVMETNTTLNALAYIYTSYDYITDEVL